MNEEGSEDKRRLTKCKCNYFISLQKKIFASGCKIVLELSYIFGKENIRLGDIPITTLGSSLSATQKKSALKHSEHWVLTSILYAAVH